MFSFIVFISVLLQFAVCNNFKMCGPAGKCTCYGIQNGQNDFVIDCSETMLDTGRICEFIRNSTAIHVTRLIARRNSYDDESSFEGCQQIKELVLSHNAFRRINSISFTPIEDLTLLDLSYNELDIYEQEWNLESLIHSTLTTLMLNGNVNETALASHNLRYPNLDSLPLLNDLSMDGLPEIQVNIGAHATNHLEILSLSGFTGFCNISYVTIDMFSLVKRIRFLNISNCNLKYIDIGSLKMLAHLEVLDMSFNTELGFKALSNTSWDLQFANLSVLNFSKVHNTFGRGTVVRKSDLCYLWNTTLRELVLDSNRIQLFETNSVLLLPKSLEILRANDNKFTFGPYLMQQSCVSNLREFYASYLNKPHAPNKYAKEKYSNGYDDCDIHPPNECPFMASAFLKNISSQIEGCKFYDSENVKTTYPSFPKRIKKIIFRNSGMNYDLIPFLVTPFNNEVEHIDASGNIFTNWIGPVGPFWNLKRLDLSNTYCSHIGSESFAGGYHSLENLQIQQNFIGLALEEYIDKPSVFRHLLALKTLNMSASRIRKLPFEIFFNLSNLETLDLSFNVIENWNVDVSTLSSLTHLNLSSNFITYLPNTLTSHLVFVSKRRRVNFTLNLSNNSITCSCRNKVFLKWLVRYKYNLIGYSDYIFLDGDRNQLTVNEFEQYVRNLSKSCTSYVAIIVVCSITLTVFLSIVIGGFVYKNRWKLRYFLYLSKQRYYGYRAVPNEEPIENYKYDAFISYAEEELRFIIQGIIPNLEQRGLSLCIHQRDFLPGNNVADNIIDAIQSSKRTVVILTKAFLKSKWCMYEFNMARMESIYSREDKGCLLIVLLEDIPIKKMPLERLNWIRYHSYLEYTKEAEGEALFWNSLRDAITASTLRLQRNYGATRTTIL